MRPFRIFLLIAIVALAIPYGLAPFYRTGHPVSALMAWHSLRGDPVIRHWMDLAAMSPALPASVVAAEDAHFCKHHGIDWGALREVIDEAQEGGEVRGASTITQQVAKNLFLWGGRSFVRKALEFPLALWINLVLPKWRVLEIYLNVAEWGPGGEFGIEAGARRAFGKPARALNAREAALMAASLPNPHKRNPRQPGPGLRRLAGLYMARAARSPHVDDCVSQSP